MKQPNFIRIMVRPRLPEALKMLELLVNDTRWSWYPGAFDLFRMIDPELWWSSKHAPKVFLSRINYDRLEDIAHDTKFMSMCQTVCDRYQREIGPRPEVPLVDRDSRRNCVAYFSLEFGIHESLPLYSGGLGILAGDHLKSASDLKLPLVAVGLFYCHGYFDQTIDSNGWQVEEYANNDFDMIPVLPVKDRQGKQMQVQVPLLDQTLHAQVWELRVGNVSLYLLDADIVENSPELRRVTLQLYGGDRTMRLQQELLLGIGGYQALVQMNYLPHACHMNEGHSAFLSIARISDLQKRYQLSLDEALELNHQTNIFTTHTPVPAGNEAFGVDLVRPYLNRVLADNELTADRVIGFGQAAGYDSSKLSMTILGLRCAAFANGVSQLHGAVSRDMWQHVWSELPVAEVPIGAITNGVHPGSWVSTYNHNLFSIYLGVNWEMKTDWQEEELANVDCIPDYELLRAHSLSKGMLVEQARMIMQHHSHQVRSSMSSQVLTIGFARRFATYKRATLLLRDPDRLERIIRNSNQPVQFIFAGKAHPADEPGKHLIQSIIRFARDRNLEHAFVFLDNYNIQVARLLVQGVDVWLNNPIRPEEASGTSGMKAAMNGVPNFSILDGWWEEGYHKSCGWKIENSKCLEPNQRDAEEAESLYQTLENEIVPAYYFRENEVQTLWVRYMKNAIKRSLHAFSSHRMVSDYHKRYYQPAMNRYEKLTANNAVSLREFYQKKLQVLQEMQHVRIFSPVLYAEGKEQGVHDDLVFDSNEVLDVRVAVEHDKLAAEDLVVELYLAPCGWVGEDFAFGRIQERGKVFIMKLREGNGKRSSFGYLLSCAQIRSSAVGVRVCPKEATLRDMSPGYMVWY